MRNSVLVLMSALVLTIVPAAAQATAKPAPQAKTAAASKRAWTPPAYAGRPTRSSREYRPTTPSHLCHGKRKPEKNFIPKPNWRLFKSGNANVLLRLKTKVSRPRTIQASKVHPRRRPLRSSQYGLDWLQSKVAWNQRTSMIVGPEGNHFPDPASPR